MKRSAVISECGKYRYSLTRIWDEYLPVVCWVMLNPSTADADVDDPTIRKCLGFSRQWDMGGMVVVNLFAWRSTDPKGIGSRLEHVGPDNDHAIVDACAGNLTVAAWGAQPGLAVRQARMKAILYPNAMTVVCLGRTKNGSPRHPLYVPYSEQQLLFWEK